MAIHCQEHGHLTLNAQHFLKRKTSHSEELIECLDRLLSEARIELKSLSRLITNSGPGSFTGLRVGYAALKGISTVHNIPIESLDGSEATAIRFFQNHKGQEVRVLSLLTPRKVLADTYERDAIGCRLNQRLSLKPSDIVPAEYPTICHPDLAELINFPTLKYELTAADLGSVYSLSKSRIKATTLLERINLSPSYFGDRFIKGKQYS